MNPRLRPLFAGAVLLSLLAIPLVLKRANKSAASDNAGDNSAPMLLSAQAQKASLQRYGFSLAENAKTAGLKFSHRAPKLDAKLDPIMPQIASMGAGVAVADFDRDGWPDIYVTDSSAQGANKLFRNDHHGQFTDVAAVMGVAKVNSRETGCSMGAVWGDVDNDGYEDLLVYKWGRSELFLNKGGKKFVRVQNAGLPPWANINSAVWLDYDRDGKLDVFLGGYYPESLNLWKLANTRIMPDSFEYAQNGGRKYLLHNLGGGKFQDATEQMGLNSRRWSLAACAADLRGTGYPDLFVANDYGVSELWANQNGKKFVEIGKASGVGYAPKSGMNASVGDAFNNGQFAIYVSNISEEGILLQGNNLWVPKPGAQGVTSQYINMARDMGVELGGWSFGSQWGDLNNDGHLDLYVTNGFVSASRGDSYWYDYSKITGGNSTIIHDAKNWPDMKGRSLSGYQAKRVYLNDGAGKFQDVAQDVGASDRYDGRAVALGDFSNRGALDVVVSNQRGPLLFYRNTVTPQNAWMSFDLRGSKSNASAIGARVTLLWTNAGSAQTQAQEVSGGSGFCAQNDRRLHFGLGANAKLKSAIVRWPSGKTQTLSALKSGQIMTVTEPA